MNTRIAALVICSFAAVAPAFGAYALPNVLAELEKKEKSLQVITFNFEQEIFFKQMNTQSTVGGKAVFGKAGKLHIAKEHPDKQVTISDGKKVWVYNPAFNQVWEGNSKAWLESSVLPKGLVPLDNYVADLRKNFNLSLKEVPDGDGNAIQLMATPKNKDAGYRLEIVISTVSWLPTKTVYTSDSATVVTHWLHPDVNPVVEKSTFQFSAPKGVDVIPLN